MSIIYDALEKTQRNLLNKKKTHYLNFTKQQYRLFGLLFIFIVSVPMILYVYYSSHTKKITPHNTAKPTHQVTIQPKPSANLPVMVPPAALPVMPLVVQNTGRDPFQMQAPSHISATLPVANLPELNNNLILNGVFISELEKIALINNQPYHIGDVVQGLKIISIDMDNVKLSNDKNSFVIHAVS